MNKKKFISPSTTTRQVRTSILCGSGNNNIVIGGNTQTGDGIGLGGQTPPSDGPGNSADARGRRSIQNFN